MISCSAQTQSRTERITIIIKVAQRYIGIGEVTVDEINDVPTAVVQVIMWSFQFSNGMPEAFVSSFKFIYSYIHACMHACMNGPPK